MNGVFSRVFLSRVFNFKILFTVSRLQIAVLAERDGQSPATRRRFPQLRKGGPLRFLQLTATTLPLLGNRRSAGNPAIMAASRENVFSNIISVWGSNLQSLLIPQRKKG
ncbi:hypothetical protein NBH19_21640 [Rhizobium sp. S95]|uniref:Uncharacterized protein n=1 Tax=Ciceribacter sichuanensis TaxID=2949647 RepID=A0AAJ1F7F3_9HYPH|nr:MULTISPECIES: hypothetical protein [unclassified Ciceribacter]MCM2398685.1 hypothetical protein [Ciceribacter sp. S95]MCO5957109.1 hypothetical protein [Ciceribacter sp. S101]